MRVCVLLCCVGLFSTGVFGQKKYAVSLIPDELRKDVNAVVREDHMTFRILSRSKATHTVRMVATIFNGGGKQYAQPYVGYDKLSKVSSFKGNIYDAQGGLIRKLKSGEIEDRSAFDGYSLFSDNRYKSADMTHSVYPYTVEYEYEVEYRFLYAIPGSALTPGEKVSVENFSYTLIFPPDLAPRYKLINIDTPPQHNKNADGSESLSWTFKNILPIKIEPHGPFIHEQIARIMAAPSSFEYEGYVGDMSTWESFGEWENKLNEGRDVLPPETRQKITELTSKLSTTEEKVKAVYEYLQNKTRYVSISFGIGGLQPFEASLVDKVGYGDCKALSNYMVALLNVVGIKGHYATVKAGDFREDLILDFPSHQGNHVIVAVPLQPDTLWLECTSQTNPFGYMGNFTGNRKAFMLTETGGVWANTPKYTHETNYQTRVADVYVDANGDAKGTVTTTYSGLKYEHQGLNFYVNNGPEDQKKWVLRTTNIPSFDLNKFSIVNHKNKIPSAVVSLDLTLRRFSALSGKRLSFTPNLMNRSSFLPAKVDNRKTNVYQRMGYTDVDTIKYHLPESIYPEFLPDPVKIVSPFGVYESSLQVDQGSVIYIRKMQVYKGEFPAASYNDMIDFYKAINKADNAKLVFLTKT
ncbi:MAG: DUF3857 domain-containing transglutaminase family protein [Cyclobacteriaceae bacterium]|nr:DUF3857 domain-containing transglutaminase family protein [Cyclobacteriaceae bacterium]